MITLSQPFQRYSCCLNSMLINDNAYEKQAAAAIESILERHNSPLHETLSLEAYESSVWITGDHFRDYELLDGRVVDDYTRALLAQEESIAPQSIYKKEEDHVHNHR